MPVHFALWTPPAGIRRIRARLRALATQQRTHVGHVRGVPVRRSWSRRIVSRRTLVCSVGRNSAEVVATMVGIAAGGPLYAWGGYSARRRGQCPSSPSCTVLSPRRCPVCRVQESADETIDGDAFRLGVLPALCRDAPGRVSPKRRARGPVRHIVLITGVLMGVTAYDEYFPLLAREQGAATAEVPILMARRDRRPGRRHGARRAAQNDCRSARSRLSWPSQGW